MAATFVIFIVAGTTRATYVLVRNDLVCKVCITNWSHEPFLRPSVAAPTFISLRRKKSCLWRETLVEFLSTLRGRSVPGSEGRHNMQYIDDIGCLTQRSQLDRLQEFADRITRERIRALQPSDLLATSVFTIGPSGKESSWELDHLAVARSATEAAVQLLLDPEAVLDNLVPTQAIMRIVRDSGASAVALIAPMSASAAALQLADVDHEQSLTARIVHQPDTEPSLSPWDFGKVAWTVRLRHVLRAARGASAEEAVQPAARPTTAPVRQTEPAVGRQSLRREMREQLHRAPAAAPSWIQ